MRIQSTSVRRAGAACIASLFATVAFTAAPPPPVGPASRLAPPLSESLALVVPAKGVQIYECRARKDTGDYGWVFVAPEAALLDREGRTIGLHSAGPLWQASDGSRIVGTVKERADAPIPGAIPWLLLGTRADGPKGRFSDITSIQRINTAGGIAPAVGCAEGSAGAIARVDYTADYYFFTPK